ncbi:hypothetical protein [Fibrella forsythiae]|uniref:Lipoprotein n=1 Tax=Fibrella forsythiae TaxID=2817061 RepID=A0ABS3JGV1_9BACT|nr:hypothetical protein [Fibrella forsythiae]MBO0949242.1 hypothetical protein [Fibrella forsythiae]
MKKMLIFFVLLGMISCKREAMNANTCRVGNPLTELQWLNDRVAQSATLGNLAVYQAIYQGQTVFAIRLYMGPDAGIYNIHRCDGSVICSSTITIVGEQGDCGPIRNELTNSLLILEKNQ